MDKVKNIRQALRVMQKKFPGVYVSVKSQLHGHSSRTNVERRIYTSHPLDTDGLGVSGQAKTWDGAFEALDSKIRSLSDERPVD